VQIVPLTPDRLDDWLAFFDGPAFSDHPEWATCYCRIHHLDGGGDAAWEAACANPGENRTAMIGRIRAGQIDGLLAFRDGRPIGWVQFGPTARFRMPHGRLEPAEDGVASIVCFVVAPGHRRTGVARALLRGAVEELARRGFRAVDARPRSEQQESAAEEFMGPLPLFLAEGFEVAEPGPRRTRVRRALASS
jgi:ribosomal protein S18 acetylase RimI-like enzyme